MTEESGGGGAALLVVDVQHQAVQNGPYEVDAVMRNIASLIAACRSAGVDVIYVQHDGEPGSDEEPGSEGWEIHAAIRPEPGETVIRKRFNSAFRGTDLESHLTSAGVKTLILVGIQTEYCVDTTCRVAFEKGFRVVMPELTNTTFNNGDIPARQIYQLYNERIFAGRFARVLPVDEAIAMVARREAPAS